MHKIMENITKKLQLSGNKLMWHQKELEKWKIGKMFPPIYIEFGPTSFCNHKCVHCYVQEAVKNPVSIDKNIYLRFMKEIGEYGVKAIVLGGCGEPFIHKTSVSAIEIAVKNGTDVGVLTNGIPIKEKNIPSLMENLTYIRFSVSGGSAESYSSIHKCNPNEWEKIRDTMRKSVEYRDKNNAKCTLGAYTLISDKNLLEIENWTKEVKDMGFDYIMIKPPAPGLDKKVFVNQANLNEVNPLLEKIVKLEDDNFQVMIRNDLFEDKGQCKREYEKCLGLPFMCAVDSDGSVYACNWFWGNENFCYGNLNENTFPEIWESEKKEKILGRISSPDFDFSKCGECRQNNINKWLEEVNQEKIKLEVPIGNTPRHVNFI